MVISLDSRVEFVLFMGRAGLMGRQISDRPSWSSTWTHPATGAHCAPSTAEICLTVNAQPPDVLWHFPCNLFSYTNDHQTACAHRGSSASCLQGELAEWVWVRRTLPPPRRARSHRSDVSSEVLSPAAKRISLDIWLEDFIFIFHAYLLTSPILNIYLFSHVTLL